MSRSITNPCLSVGLVVGMMVGAVGAANAQAAKAFPSKPVRIVVAFSPGSAPDVVARALSDRLSARWGQSVVVENKLGADGTIAADFVARSAPDGHTLLMATMGNLVLTPLTMPNLPYDGRAAFRGAGFITNNPFAILVSNQIPANTIQEFVALSKSRSHGLNYGSAGTLGPLVGDLITKRTGADLAYIPYKGVQPALVDMVGGQINSAIADLPSLMPLAQQGKAKLIAVTTKERSAMAPDVPTLVEAGYQDVDFSTWYALAAPAATPDDIIAQVNAGINAVLQTPEVIERLKGLGMTPTQMSPQELDQLIEKELARWAVIVKQAG